MFNYLVVFLALIYASYTDFTKREISNYLTFSLMFFGLTYNLVFGIINSNLQNFFYGLLIFVIVFLVCYLFWKLGVFAGGDAKLFSGICAMIPYQDYSIFGSLPNSNYLFIVSLFLLSLLVIFPYGALIGFLAILRKKDVLGYLYKELIVKSFSILESILVIVSLYLVLSFFKLSSVLILPLSIIAGFVPRKMKLPFLFFLFPIAMYLDFFNNLKIIFVIALCSYLLWFVFKLFFLTRSGLLNYFVKVKDLKEGDLLAYPLIIAEEKLIPFKDNSTKSLLSAIKTFDKTKIEQVLKENREKQKNIVIENTLASGLTKENILYIWKHIYNEENIELKKTTPLVPAILIAYCIMVLFGDVIWYLIKFI